MLDPGDLAGRLAVVPMSQEARGLDAGPRLADKLVGCGDNRTAAIVSRIALEEKAHVAVGTSPALPFWHVVSLLLVFISSMLTIISTVGYWPVLPLLLVSTTLHYGSTRFCRLLQACHDILQCCYPESGVPLFHARL